jgi:hypothetical protein
MTSSPRLVGLVGVVGLVGLVGVLGACGAKPDDRSEQLANQPAATTTRQRAAPPAAPPAEITAPPLFSTPDAVRFWDLMQACHAAILPFSRKPHDTLCTDPTCFDCAGAGRAWQGFLDGHGRELAALTPKFSRWQAALADEDGETVNRALLPSMAIVLRLEMACAATPSVDTAREAWDALF